MVRSISLITLALTAVSPVLSAPYFERRQLVTPNVGLPNGLSQAPLGSFAGPSGVNQTYDYVVIGSGTSGSALGTRLAEAGHSVAILEAGEFYEVTKPVLASTPGGDFTFVGANMTDSDPFVDWEFQTTKQSGANDRAVHYARGKCAGGS